MAARQGADHSNAEANPNGPRPEARAAGEPRGTHDIEAKQFSTGRASSGWRLIALLVCLLILLAVASLATGPARLSLPDILAAFTAGPDDPRRIIVLEIRLPRLILALAIGGILGLSGAAMQGLLRNPLAEPALFGAPQAAAFAAVSTISLGLNATLSWGLPVAAILGALASVTLLLAIVGRNGSLLLLILAGLAVSSLAGAGTALALNLAPSPFAAIEIAFWLLGSLEDRSFRHVMLALPFIALAATLLMLHQNGFRVLALGEETAASLGVDVNRLRLIVILAMALGVGASVAVAGAIGFIGLVAPHLMRPLVRHDPARLLLPAALCGAALLTTADIAVRLIPATSEIKVGVLTSLIGVPFFLAMILRERARLAGGVL